MGTRTRELIALGHHLVIESSDDDTYLMTLQREVDDEVLSLLGRIVPDDGVVLDVGANIGVHAITLAKLAPKGHVHAFEPAPATVPHLEANVRRNGVDNVTCHALALGEREGSASLDENPAFSAGSKVVDHAGPVARSDIVTASGEHDPERIVTVRTTTVDAVTEELGLDRVDVLKIDVEGCELDVLRGAQRTLATFRPIVIVEFATFALTVHRGMLPTEALDEIRRTFDHTFVVERWGKVRKMVTDRNALDLLWENANIRPVQDLVGAFEGSRLLGALDEMAAARRGADPPPPELTEVEVALDEERQWTAELTNELEWTERRATELEETVTALQRALAAKGEEAAHLAGEIEAIHRTLSWRLMGPLRWVRKRIPPRDR